MPRSQPSVIQRLTGQFMDLDGETQDIVLDVFKGIAAQRTQRLPKPRTRTAPTPKVDAAAPELPATPRPKRTRVGRAARDPQPALVETTDAPAEPAE